MRIVASFEKEVLAQRFSLFLEKEKIENTYETLYDKKQRKTLHNIWVHNEDELSKANQYYEEFIKDPFSSKYDIKIKDIQKEEVDINQDISQKKYVDPIAMKRYFPYKITFFFLILCIGLYFVNFVQEINVLKQYNMKQLIVLTNLQKIFLYDLPEEFVQLEDVIIKNRLKTEKELANPPKQAVEELEKIKPFWRGIDYIVLRKFQKNKNEIDYSSYPSFEKIKKGQIWRLFTPAVLHSGFLHILFNMLWLWYLGKQMEPRLRFIRYLLFIIIIAVISNTAQYLMGGFLFLGYSGVITGMIGYIFVRQKIAPWEGYNIPNAVFYFISIFILAMLFLQIAAFVFQIYKPKLGFTPGIANTAHIVGALIGMILAKIPFFSWRTSE